MEQVKQSVAQVYTPLEDALRELERRRADRSIMQRMDSFFSKLGVPFIDLAPAFVFCRDIITPNHEYERVRELATSLPLALFEFDAKFVAANNDSYHLCRLRFDSNSGNGSECLRIVDFNAYEGKYFSEIQTVNGILLHSFHHKMLDYMFPNTSNSIRDITTWFLVTRELSPHYYFHFLALFLTHGILLENYVVEQASEADFFFQRMLPSFLMCEQEFGLRPLIVPPLPLELEESNHWVTYTHDIMDFATQQMHVA